MDVILERGDITRQSTDAIVNAANTGLWGGGGVDGAIHRAAGPELARTCSRIREERGPKPCPTGEAVITQGFELPARYVIHTAGPRWLGGNAGETDLLRRCYVNCLELAEKHGIRSIAFPAISTGVYGFPIRPAARIALDAVLGFSCRTVTEVRFVLFSDRDHAIYREEYKRRRIGADARDPD
jgi:O-acetyl-ADP-ribose deacetylase (regulator of RNase III)